MTAAWVAGSVRARAMARRRLGSAGARALAGRPGLDEAVEALARSPYGDRVHPGHTLGQAQHAVAATLLWNLRVLAGWLPAGGTEMLRLLAGWYEAANVDERLRGIAGAPADPPFHLGARASAWPRLADATSVADLRAALATSTWGDPGGDSPHDIVLGMRVAWAARVAAGVPEAAAWAAGGLALLVARERFVRGRAVPGAAARAAVPLLGAAWPDATSIGELAAVLPPAARWALRGTTRPADLWLAEGRWWTRVAGDGAALAVKADFGPHRVIGAVALLAADAWRVRAALEIAARGGGPVEVFDAVA